MTNQIERVLAKVHVEDKGKCLIHYITKESDTIAYVPLSEIFGDKMSGKWAAILSVIKCAWERGDTNIYAMLRLEPEPEFILTNKNIKMPPLDKITGCLKKELIIEGQPMIYRMVEAAELDELLNNK